MSDICLAFSDLTVERFSVRSFRCRHDEGPFRAGAPARTGLRFMLRLATS